MLMWWLVILIIGGFFLVSFFIEREKMLKTTVDKHGGLQNKYPELISWMTDHPNAKITKVTRQSIEIRCDLKITFTEFIILQEFNRIRISWEANLGVLGMHSNTWIFKPDDSEETIIEVIGTYINSKGNNFFSDDQINEEELKKQKAKERRDQIKREKKAKARQEQMERDEKARERKEQLARDEKAKEHSSSKPDIQELFKHSQVIQELLLTLEKEGEIDIMDFKAVANKLNDRLGETEFAAIFDDVRRLYIVASKQPNVAGPEFDYKSIFKKDLFSLIFDEVFIPAMDIYRKNEVIAKAPKNLDDFKREMDCMIFNITHTTSHLLMYKGVGEHFQITEKFFAFIFNHYKDHKLYSPSIYIEDFAFKLIKQKFEIYRSELVKLAGKQENDLVKLMIIDNTDNFITMEQFNDFKTRIDTSFTEVMTLNYAQFVEFHSEGVMKF